MSGNNIRKTAARMLLGLYLTLVGLTSVHTHYQPEVMCGLCKHHSVHYHSAAQSVHDCLLCHFMNTPCLLTALPAVAAVAFCTAPCGEAQPRPAVAALRGRLRPRAPPAAL